MILSIFIFNLLLAVVGIFFLNMALEETVYGSRMDYSVVLMLYQMIACVEWGLAVLMMPALTAGAISGERERNTLELLLTTGMREFSIIWGKLLAALSIMMTLIVSTLPILSLVFIYGGIRYIGLLQLLAVLLVLAVYVGSICLFFSAFAKTMTFSLICSYAVLLCIIVGTLFASYLFSGNPGAQGSPVAYILLFNPLVTFGAFIYQQVGELETLAGLMGHIGMERYGFYSEHFLELSLLVQLLVSGILLWGATYGLAPSRRLFGTQSSDVGD
jgi:ABC-type transport system involved in multi-copper enzyme maturation permease subunit